MSEILRESPLLGLLPRLRFVLRLCALFTVAICTTSFWGVAVHAAAVSDRIKLTVIGDSLADGVWAGLSRNTREQKKFRIRRAAKVSSGLAAYNWHAEASKLLSDAPDVVVIMLGANDGQAIRRRGEPRIGYRAQGWRNEYANKVDKLLTLFAERNVYTVWVGLPMMRKDSMRAQAKLLNGIFAETVTGRPDVHYLPTWDLTVDVNGEYAAYAEIDDTGRQRQFRAQDGVHFTMLGYQFLARHVQEVIEDRLQHQRKAAKRNEECLGIVD